MIIVRLILVLLVVSTVNSMDQRIVPHTKVKKENLFVSQKQFDAIQLKDLREWFSALPASQQKILREHNDKQDKQCQVLFHFAIDLPRDVQRIVISHMFAGDAGRAERFFNTPLYWGFWNVQRDAWCEESASWKIFDFIRNSYYVDANSRCTSRHLFRLSQEIRFMHKVFTDQSAAFKGGRGRLNLSRAELEVFNALEEQLELKKIRNHALDLHYQFKDSYSLANFRKHFNRDWLFLIPLGMIPLASMVAIKSCYDMENQDIINENRLYDFLNPLLEAQHIKTGDSFWLSCMKTCKDPLVNRFNYGKGLAKLLIHLSGFSMLRLFTGYKVQLCGFYDSPSLLFAAITFGCEQVLSRWIFQSADVMDLYVAGGIFTSVALVSACVQTIYDMREVRQGYSSFNELPDLLKRTDIIIQ